MLSKDGFHRKFRRRDTIGPRDSISAPVLGLWALHENAKPPVTGISIHAAVRPEWLIVRRNGEVGVTVLNPTSGWLIGISE